MYHFMKWKNIFAGMIRTRKVFSINKKRAGSDLSLLFNYMEMICYEAGVPAAPGIMIIPRIIKTAPARLMKNGFLAS